MIMRMGIASSREVAILTRDRLVSRGAPCSPGAGRTLPGKGIAGAGGFIAIGAALATCCCVSLYGVAPGRP